MEASCVLRGQTTRHLKLAVDLFTTSTGFAIAGLAVSVAACGPASASGRLDPALDPTLAPAAAWTFSDSAVPPPALTDPTIRAAVAAREVRFARTGGDSLAAIIAIGDSAASPGRASPGTATSDQLSRGDPAGLRRAASTLAPRLRTLPGVTTVALALPAADTAAFPTVRFLPLVDAIVVSLVDEHTVNTDPGPLASPRWIRRVLGARVAEVGPQRLVAELPSYGYLWRPNTQARRLSLAEARHAVSEAGVELTRDPVSGSLHATSPGAWELWIADSLALARLSGEVRSLGVSRILIR